MHEHAVLRAVKLGYRGALFNYSFVRVVGTNEKLDSLSWGSDFLVAVAFALASLVHVVFISFRDYFVFCCKINILIINTLTVFYYSTECVCCQVKVM